LNDVTIGGDVTLLALDQDEAQCVVTLMAIAWDEGLGADGDDALLARIREQFPNLEIPAVLRP
jgi:hypothetical protein